MPRLSESFREWHSALLRAVRLETQASFHPRIKAGKEGVLMEEKAKIRPNWLRHLQTQKSQAAVMTFAPQFRGGFSSNRQAKTRANSETQDSLKVDGGRVTS
jgi:hypothetical protein